MAFDHGPASTLYLSSTTPTPAYDRARAAGAEIVRGLTDHDYGSREFTARDPEGNLWSFGTYRPAAPSASAGAVRASPARALP